MNFPSFDQWSSIHFTSHYLILFQSLVYLDSTSNTFTLLASYDVLFYEGGDQQP